MLFAQVRIYAITKQNLVLTAKQSISNKNKYAVTYLCSCVFLSRLEGITSQISINVVNY